MKHPKAAIILSFLLLITLSVYAQQGKDDGSRFGRGKDSIDCLLNVGMSREYVKQKDYKKAYLPWKAAISSCPKSQASLYSDGVKILHSLLETEKDSVKRRIYLDDLNDLYDKNILYKAELEQFLQAPLRKDYLLAAKAYDYLHYAKESLNLQQAYQFVREAVDNIEKNPAYYLFTTWMDVNLLIYQVNPDFKSTFINDYLNAVSIIQQSCKNTNKKDQQVWDKVLSSVNDIFHQSGLDKELPETDEQLSCHEMPQPIL